MYEAKNFEHLLGTPGLSDDLLKNHFTLYQGYVKNINILNDSLVEMERNAKFNTPEYSELNRRFGWEWNGMRLHEYYFENITIEKKEFSADSELAKKIVDEWGSLETWEKDFKSMGTMRGIGWVVLYYDKMTNRLFNVWINEHDTGHLAGCQPLLVMDVFEHAYMTDYGTKKPDYIEAFWKAIDWEEAQRRFTK